MAHYWKFENKYISNNIKLRNELCYENPYIIICIHIKTY